MSIDPYRPPQADPSADTIPSTKNRTLPSTSARTLFASCVGAIAIFASLVVYSMTWTDFGIGPFGAAVLIVISPAVSVAWVLWPRMAEHGGLGAISWGEIARIWAIVVAGSICGAAVLTVVLMLASGPLHDLGVDV